MNRTWLLAGLVALSFAGSASATMRCGTALISVGDSASVVREKCGPPDSAVDEMPAVRSNGVPQLNAAKITHWVYGPRNGASQHLRFVEDKLVSIEMRRD
ncbi:DUF2845 domain-containing protein [Pseudomonas sp. NPDC090202]|uniref:DUF2845 domain-containing protein n=1 Tax=unclassified Pseudomonas TaxID=196821 RepID=UPI00381D7575